MRHVLVLFIALLALASTATSTGATTQAFVVLEVQTADVAFVVVHMVWQGPATAVFYYQAANGSISPPAFGVGTGGQVVNASVVAEAAIDNTGRSSGSFGFPVFPGARRAVIMVVGDVKEWDYQVEEGIVATEIARGPARALDARDFGLFHAEAAGPLARLAVARGEFPLHVDGRLFGYASPPGVLSMDVGDITIEGPTSATCSCFFRPSQDGSAWGPGDYTIAWEAARIEVLHGPAIGIADVPAAALI